MIWSMLTESGKQDEGLEDFLSQVALSQGLRTIIVSC